MASLYTVALLLGPGLAVASPRSDSVEHGLRLEITPLHIGYDLQLSCLWTPTDFDADEFIWNFHRNGAKVNITVTSESAKYAVTQLDDPHGSQLQVKGVRAEDHGVYYCETQIQNMKYGATFELQKAEESWEIEMVLAHGETSTVSVGGSVHFLCDVNGGSTKNLTWGFRNMTSGEVKQTFSQVHSDRTQDSLSVELYVMTLEQNGTYYCSLPDLGLLETLAIRVIGIYIKCEPDDVTVRAYNDAVLSCHIFSIPDVNRIEWKVEGSWPGQQIKPSKKYSITRPKQINGRMRTSLTIINVVPNDEAEYTVIAYAEGAQSQHESVMLTIGDDCVHCHQSERCVQGRCTCPEGMNPNPDASSPPCVGTNFRPSENTDDSDTRRNEGDVVISQSSIAWVIGGAIGTLALIVSIIIAVICYKRRNYKLSKPDGVFHDPTYQYEYHSEAATIKELPQFANPGYQTSPPRESTTKENAYVSLSKARLEFPRQHLQLGADLGQGRFGKVIQARARNISGNGQWDTVAVKTCRATATDAEKEDLYSELEIMRKIPPHANVVALLRCCAQTDPLFIIMEYANRGSLSHYLRQCRPSSRMSHLSDVTIASRNSSFMQPRAKDLTIFALQVARGMAHVASCGIIHRDLAARNVLLSTDFTCKICDFGLARDVEGVDVYERTSQGPLPIRWMAPESLKDNCYTRKSDVWSYGILLWEIVTLGATPYSGMSAMEVMRQVLNGSMLQRPVHCKQEMYELMMLCWAKERERPAFSDIVTHHEALMDDDYILLSDYDEDDYDWLDSYTLDERV